MALRLRMFPEGDKITGLPESRFRERMADLRMESIILLLFRPILLWQ